MGLCLGPPDLHRMQLPGEGVRLGGGASEDAMGGEQVVNLAGDLHPAAGQRPMR